MYENFESEDLTYNENGHFKHHGVPTHICFKRLKILNENLPSGLNCTLITGSPCPGIEEVHRVTGLTRNTASG